MSHIILGKANGRNIGFDIPELLVSRLLVQANSGGGKSYLLRRILEQAYGKVQAIVIDPAGEFSTLREKYGYVLVGEHGETPADVRSAGLVAEKLLELRASAVCDLYSLKPAVRHTWVQHFLTAVMNAPKRLWHPVLFVVDEAHKFAPEKGEGESEAKEPMLSLASDGRKYGFCGIFATQRLAKLDKSLASELLNVLIGPTFMDIDLQRAHKALGIVTKEQAAFNEQMKTIRPGNFWALGRAISKHRVLVKIGEVETTHPQAGSGKYSAEPPPPPEKIKALLPKLADLPKAAEEKARTEAEFKREIRELKSKLSAVSRQPSAQPVGLADPEKLQRRIDTEVYRAQKDRDVEWNAAVRLYQRDLSEKLKETGSMLSTLVTFHFLPPISHANPPQAIPNVKQSSRPKPQLEIHHALAEAGSRALAERLDRELTADAPPNGRSLALPKGEQIILRAIAQYPEGAQRDQLTVLTGYKRSTRDAYIQRLREKEFLIENGSGAVVATDGGIAALGSSYEPLPTGEALQAYWLNRLPEGERKIFAALLATPSGLSRESLEEATGYKRSTRDAYIQRLQSRRLIEIVGRGEVRPSENLFA